jgi:hypothetical protein
MCHIRKDIECTYRGKIIEENEHMMKIQFKTNGKLVTAEYDKREQKFLEKEFEDIKIVQ